ncbi:short-chain dehydrogenase [Bdellovibrio sp. qaytius]|nr:short-chain dehydrogenase [Bdellovibrio sp. qaytius]
MNKDLSSKVILVTGATDGIGKAAAMNFAMRGADLTIVGRSNEKTAQVAAELKQASGNNKIDFIICDLSRIADVKKGAEEFKSKHQRLDILVNNAGAVFKTPQKSPDGYELTFALNHLGYFEMTVALMDLIRNTPHARVVSTSSGLQAIGNLDLEKTPTSLEGSGTNAYATSKLANVLFTKELQQRLKGTTATANCFEPGIVRTQFGALSKDLGFFMNLAYKIVMPFMVTPEKGADSLIWLATSPEASSLKGELVANRKPKTPNKQALNKNLAKDLWALSEKLCAQAIQ